MKKLITAALALLMTVNIAFAQDKKKPAEGKKATTEQTKSEAPKKKDGTPDMRYKENKAAKSEGPKKKDGTPDMRYKENKDAKEKKDKKTTTTTKKAA
ncbi:hypothetical protein MKQ70_20775 [Chitinophaga sedimenti]|uniref:hypothetical protein n=1 Tax=Chitinophaga sedimenti TaxID=2033606 RepID=UPI002003819B|nr:hypothetical protein [Chitinophaga sedimenti]MCK7557305.1 hypothetical protein [Chitinophaga sedimenti]